jgi:DNA-binding LytR/AlgR family response regulator
MIPLKVLIVEDETLIAELIKIYLAERGHELIGNPISYQEAIDSFTFLEPDIVLLDIRLYGEKSGIDVAYYLKENKPHLPFIFLTSQFDQKHLDNALATGPFGYLTKPVQKETLWTTLESAFNKSNFSKTDDLHIIVFDGQKNINLAEKDILYLEANHVYVEIHMANGKTIIVRNSLNNMVAQLNAKVFIQCHRSFIININHTQSWDLNSIMIRNKDIPISRSQKKNIVSKLKNRL